jgi:hypothetical protein
LLATLKLPEPGADSDDEPDPISNVKFKEGTLLSVAGTKAATAQHFDTENDTNAVTFRSGTLLAAAGERSAASRDPWDPTDDRDHIQFKAGSLLSTGLQSRNEVDY